MSCEITVRLKGADFINTKRFLHYEDQGIPILSRECPILNGYVNESKENIIKDNLDTIIVKTEMVW